MLPILKPKARKLVAESVSEWQPIRRNRRLQVSCADFGFYSRRQQLGLQPLPIHGGARPHRAHACAVRPVSSRDFERHRSP
jgi:hypothetical protein